MTLLAATAVAVAILVVTGVLAIYSSEPVVKYWQATNYEYQRTSEGWVTFNFATNETSNGTFTTVYCQDTGLSDCRLDLIVRLTNATFLQNGTNQQTCGTVAKLSMTLQSGETNSTRLYFSIDQNANRFFILLTLKANQLFMRSNVANWDGQNPIPYEKTLNNNFDPDLVC